MRQLAIVLDNQFDILERVVQDALAENTKPRQRLAIYKYLAKRVDELMEAVHADRRNVGDEHPCQCQLQYYYPPVETVNTLVLTCPGMGMMRLWPLPV